MLDRPSAHCTSEFYGLGIFIIKVLEGHNRETTDSIMWISTSATFSSYRTEKIFGLEIW